MPASTAALFAELGPWSSELRVALGFSGGADSVFLLRAWQAALRSGAAEGCWVATWVVDHGHTGDSPERAQAAAALAETAGAAGVGILRPGAHQVAPSMANEDRLRWLRYAAFAEAAREQKIDVLLLGHQADDQAETLMMRILRGTGLYGLAGIPERREMAWPADDVGSADGAVARRWNAEADGKTEVRRPLLSLRRADIRERLARTNQTWIEDPSNADPTAATRNGLRLLGFPQLEEYATGTVVQALLRLQREAAAWKHDQVSGVVEMLQHAPWREGSGWQRRAAIRHLLREAEETVSEARLQDLDGALQRRGSANINLHQRLTIAGGPLRLAPRADAPSVS